MDHDTNAGPPRITAPATEPTASAAARFRRLPSDCLPILADDWPEHSRNAAVARPVGRQD